MALVHKLLVGVFVAPFVPYELLAQYNHQKSVILVLWIYFSENTIKTRILLVFEAMTEGRTAKRATGSLVHGQNFADDDFSESKSH